MINDSYNSLKRLVFRRQFLLGLAEFAPTPFFRSINCGGGLIVSAHQDLDVVTHSSESGCLTMIGFVVNPLDPSKSSSDIVKSLVEQSTNFEDVLRLSFPLAGRWILLLLDKEGAKLFTDPCGLRSVFYYRNQQGVWCGSQPEIIRAAVGLDLWDNGEMHEFMMDPRFVCRESAWVGDKTYYKGCYHLLPNHYLDLSKFASVRFFPQHTLETKPQAEVIESAAALIKGGIEALVRRSDAIMPVTSGRDSRVLLAATRYIPNRIEYYIDRIGILPENHSDVRVPRKLAKILGFDFLVKNSQEDLPGWFVQALAKNVAGARVLPKTRMIFARFAEHETRVNISGNAHLLRCHFHINDQIESKDLNIYDLAVSMSYGDLAFVDNELEAWKADLEQADSEGFHILDMLY